MASGAHPPALRLSLRRGSAVRARLLQGPLDQLVREAEGYLADSPTHPWYAGAVLLAGRGGTVALHRAIGKAVRYSAYDETTDTGVELPADRQIAMAEDTVFDLASISKLFTSILAVQQIERGALELEAAVASYLPDCRWREAGHHGPSAAHAHLRLPVLDPALQGADPGGEAPDALERGPGVHPGQRLPDSDLNLISLQLILERITGRTLDALLRDEITAPLGMHRTRYNPPASRKPKIAATEDARLPWSGLERGLVRGVRCTCTMSPVERDPSRMVAAYRQLALRARSAGLRVVGAAIGPFEGWTRWTPEQDAVRRQVNEAVRTGRIFDAVADFDAALRDPDRPSRLLPAYDSGDGLHPGPAGHTAIAATVERRYLR
ncbi:Putative D-alanyl-D-alanine carboxypeptidase [Streptomyces microflavus]